MAATIEDTVFDTLWLSVEISGNDRLDVFVDNGDGYTRMAEPITRTEALALDDAIRAHFGKDE